jgi:hypothetical protein
MTDHITHINPELNAFRSPGGLFDVEPCEMDANIGRRCVYINPECGAEHDTFTVATIQKDWTGNLCYRIVGDSDTHRFGCPASPQRIRFID